LTLLVAWRHHARAKDAAEIALVAYLEVHTEAARTVPHVQVVELHALFVEQVVLTEVGVTNLFVDDERFT